MGKLDKRVAIVTGGSTGIGRNIAMEFAKEGAKVVIGSRNVPNLEKVVEEIKALGGHCIGIATDVSVAEQVRNLAKQTVDNFGRIDILVNNAGICHSATLLEMTEEYWDEVLDVNLKGVFLCTQAVAGYMVKQKYGKIINISSNSGRGGGLDDYANYCVSKAGVIQLTKSSAFELGPYGINVNAIAPGYMATDNTAALRANKERSKAILDRIPAGRWGGKYRFARGSGIFSFFCIGLFKWINYTG